MRRRGVNRSLKADCTDFNFILYFDCTSRIFVQIFYYPYIEIFQFRIQTFMPHRIICFLEVYKTRIQFSTGFLKCVLIKECFQTKNVITGSVAFFKANLRDVYEFFFFYTLR